MSFVIKSGSKQYLVEVGQKIIVDRIKAEEDSVIEIPVLFSTAGGKTKKLQVKVLKHQKGPKIYVVKYKSKSNYHKRNGFRPAQTLLEIVSEK